MSNQDPNNNTQVLCSDRLTQMTKTYNDIGAVTRLLEEKERDLELAAKIGQTLLEKNKYFEERNEELERLLSEANERISQLRHDLSMKDELLKIYTQSYDGAEPSASTPETPELGTAPVLQKKIKSLEEENLQLHLETARLKGLTDTLEEKEQQLVTDCVQQLGDARNQLDKYAKDLAEKSEECAHQKEEITDLLHQIVSLQKKNRTLTAENMDLQKTLEAAYDTQNYLTREIADLKEKNEEILSLLEETQEELRIFRSRERPRAVRHSYMSVLNTTGESLASELENSMRSEVDYPRGYSSGDRKKHTWKVFETAKAARNAGRRISGSSCSASMLGASLGEMDDSQSVSQRSSMYLSDTESALEESSTGEQDSVCQGKLGRPGIPGSSDLHTALRRLSMRRANELNEMDYAKEERERLERERQARERALSDAAQTESDTESQTTGRCRTPDSMISANSGYMSMTGSSANYYKMPEKLRIIKPLEGSVTLRQWQRLATPHLGGIFETRPGVKIKGESKLNIGLEPEVYSLSDYEEDDEVAACPTRFPESSGVYTFTDSRVQHPSEADRTTSSCSSTTPRMASSVSIKGQGTSTYSMSLGLAALLHERDLPQDQSEGQTLRSRPPFGNVSSNPARFPSIVSETHFTKGSQSPPSSTLTLPTNSFKVISSPLSQRSDVESKENSGLSCIQGSDTPNLSQTTNNLQSQDISSQNIYTSATVGNQDANVLSVINTLKNTGFSVYGYITGGMANRENSQGSSRPTSLSLPATTSSVTTAASANLSSVAVATTISETSRSLSAVESGDDLSNRVTIATSGGSSASPKKTHLASILSNRTTGSVISALTKWHRDGTL